jgi:4-hydroxyphenylpyruvate dioxygenase
MAGHLPLVQLEAFELWVHSLTHTASTLEPFGFAPESAPSDEASRDHVAMRMHAGDVAIVLRQGTSPESPVARHVARHGDGVADVVLTCHDIEGLSARARTLGADVSTNGTAARLDVLGDGTVMHTIRPASHRRPSMERHRYGTGVEAVDHVTYCLPFGTLARVARVYETVLGFAVLHSPQTADVGDDDRGMLSQVVRAGGCTLVLTAPKTASGASQTQRFLDAHAGPGVQHVALTCGDLSAAACWLRSKGVALLSVPEEHLEQSYQRMRSWGLPWDSIRREGILVDGDHGGLLFQLFTEPITDRRTFFFELIHRDGATGFGAGNVRALFAAVDASMQPKGS